MLTQIQKATFIGKIFSSGTIPKIILISSCVGEAGMCGPSYFQNGDWLLVCQFSPKDLIGHKLNTIIRSVIEIRVVPELEIKTVSHPNTTKYIIVNVQPLCNQHFCWRRELASPATEV